ncbi:MAG: GNAT family N-acetyltransferase, partial [Acidimicrobiales bacterium]
SKPKLAAKLQAALPATRIVLLPPGRHTAPSRPCEDRPGGGVSMGAESIELEIRDADRSDVPAAAEVFRRGSLSNVNDRAALLAHPEALAFTEASLRAGRVRVACVEAKVVGFATSIRGPVALELEDLFVDPDWMRRGVGRALIADVAMFAAEIGVGVVEVDANPHAMAFYENVGFVTDAEVKTTFGVGFRMHLRVDSDAATGSTARTQTGE